MEKATFAMRIETRGDAAHVFFTGTLNEEAYGQYSSLADTLPAKCTFDFAEVSFINSTGVRDWIRFIRVVQIKRVISYERCTDSLVGNMNLMPFMVGEATVNSVLRNSTCPSCGALDATALKAGVDFTSEGTMTHDPPACQSCKAQVAWDIPDSEYFLFQQPS